MSELLREPAPAHAFHRPLRSAAATLAVARALLAAVTLRTCLHLLGTDQAVLRGASLVLATATVLLGGAIGTVRELTGGFAVSKAHMIRQLGYSPDGRCVHQPGLFHVA